MPGAQRTTAAEIDAWLPVRDDSSVTADRPAPSPQLRMRAVEFGHEHPGLESITREWSTRPAR